MSRFLALVALPLVLAVTAIGAVARTPVAAPATYDVDPVHSTALFRVQHLGAGMFWGRFNDVTGTMTVADGSNEPTAFDVSIAIASVDSGNESLDTHLKSDDFFGAESHPAMTFRSAKIARKDATTFVVTGELSLRGVTKTLTVDMVHTGTKDFGRGERCGFEGTFTIKRSDFGVSYGVQNGAVGDETRVIIALEGTRQPA